MQKKNIYVDINIIQTVPASNINRDDTGSPKTCIYGGVTRARVSSQAWKRAVRLAFKDMLPEEAVGVRTKKIVGMVEEELKKIKPDLTDKELEKKAMTALSNAGLKIKNAQARTDALMLVSKKQAQKLAELIAEDETDKKAYKAALANEPSVDMALFGRMVASDPSLNYDAACQVAHAVSTHEVQTEFDYFTAVDDLSSDDTAGAGHLGVGEFNSSTLYRYATVSCGELYRSLGQATPEVVSAFAKAFITSMPTGKQNSYANDTLPDGVYIAVRTDRPVSLVPAFESPVLPSDQGYVRRSLEKMVSYASDCEAFVDEPAASFVIGKGLEDLGKPARLSDALEQLRKTVADLLSDGEQ